VFFFIYCLSFLVSTKTPETVGSLAPHYEDLAVRLAVASPALPSADLRLAPATSFQPHLWNSTSDLRRLSHPPALLSGQPSTCVADQSSSLAFGTQPLTFASCCILQFCLPADRRLAPSANLPALPSNSTSGLRRPLHLQLCRPVNPRLASPINLSASPSNPAPDSHRSAASSNLAFQSTFDLRLQPTFQPCLRTQPPTHHRFAALSGSAFRSTFDLRLQPTFRPCLRTQPPTFIGYRILWLRFRINFRLAPDIASFGSASDQLLTSIG